MSRWSGRHEKCPECGLTYEKFKTGYKTYKEVRSLLWVADPDYSKWKYKRRSTVLGLWHQLKKSMWQEHLYYCELIALAKEEAAHDEEMERLLPMERAELLRLLEGPSGNEIVLAYQEASRSSELADVPF